MNFSLCSVALMNDTNEKDDDDKNDPLRIALLCTNAETYETVYAQYRHQLKTCLLWRIVRDYRITGANMTYVLAILLASGVELDRRVIITNRTYGELMLRPAERLAHMLRTASHIKRHVVVTRDEWLRGMQHDALVYQTTELCQCRDGGPHRLSVGANGDKLLVTVACCDTDFDAVTSRYKSEPWSSIYRPIECPVL